MKFVVQKSFFLLFIFFAVFFDYRQFFLFMLALILHEFTHILFARLFKLKTQIVTLTPLGIVATIKDINTLPIFKRLVVTISGVSMNLFLFLIFKLFSFSNEYAIYFKYVNLILFVFNSLPIYPLDGGNFFVYIYGHFNGHLTACKALLKISRIQSIFIIILGLLQTIFFPFNIFIYVMGVYLYKKSNSTTYASMFLAFYNDLALKYKIQKISKAQFIVVNENTTINDFLLKINLDSFLMCLNGLSEKNILEYTKTFPISEKLSNIVKV